jgi:plasmid maintenance system antidote protein VapI
MQNKIECRVNNQFSSSDNNLDECPKVHCGELLERIIRRDRMGISEIARRLDVSRRTIYNWFEMEHISIDTIRRIGYVIGHDFSAEFPREFAKNTDYDMDSLTETHTTLDHHPTAIYYWMDRYIKLLEKFNEVLTHETKV